MKKHVFMSFECDVLVQKKIHSFSKEAQHPKNNFKFLIGKNVLNSFFPRISRISASVQNVASLLKHPTFLSSSVSSNYFDTLVCFICLFFMFLSKLVHMIIGVLLDKKRKFEPGCNTNDCLQ